MATSSLTPSLLEQFLIAIGQGNLTNGTEQPTGLPPRQGAVITNDPAVENEARAALSNGIPVKRTGLAALPPDPNLRYSDLIRAAMPLSAQPSQERPPIQTMQLPDLPTPTQLDIDALPPRPELSQLQNRFKAEVRPQQDRLTDTERANYIAQTGQNPDFTQPDMVRDTLAGNQTRNSYLQSQADDPKNYFDAPLTPLEEQAEAIRVAQGMTPANQYDPYAQRQKIANTPYLPPLTEEMQARKDIADANAKAEAERSSAENTSRERVAAANLQAQQESRRMTGEKTGLQKPKQATPLDTLTTLIQEGAPPANPRPIRVGEKDDPAMLAIEQISATLQALQPGEKPEDYSAAAQQVMNTLGVVTITPSKSGNTLTIDYSRLGAAPTGGQGIAKHDDLNSMSQAIINAAIQAGRTPEQINALISTARSKESKAVSPPVKATTRTVPGSKDTGIIRGKYAPSEEKRKEAVAQWDKNRRTEIAKELKANGLDPKGYPGAGLLDELRAEETGRGRLLSRDDIADTVRKNLDNSGGLLRVGRGPIALVP